MFARGRATAMTVLLLLGPTLVVPVRIWHAHPCPPSIGPVATACTDACHPHTASETRSLHDAEPRKPATSVGTSCSICLLAATIHVAACPMPAPIAAPLLRPYTATTTSLVPQHITSEPRTRGPPLPA